MKKILATVLLLSCTCILWAQSDTLIRAAVQDEAIVTALRFPENIKNLPYSVKKITNKGWNMNSPNMGDVLQNSGGVFLQKSQGGGGSPVLRGFEASRVLLMVDGIRMNNAIFRAGHLQNVITVDPNILQFADILYGPSSTVFGSDALGGVVNMFTKNPQPVADKKKALSGNIAGRYSSALSEYQLHADVNFGGKNWASFTSVTTSDFGDIVQGGQRSSKYPEFGKRTFYVTTAAGGDFKTPNANPNKQIGSGYKQLDLLQKILFVPKAGREHLLNVQFSNSTDIPRYDRLTEVTGAAATPRFAEWYYGPQKRLLLAHQFSASYTNRYISKLQSTLSYQDVEESRHDRRFNNKNRNNRFERVKIVGYTLDAMHKKDKQEAHMGIDVQLNDVRSVAYAENIVTGVRSAINTRYPDGENKMNYWAAYYQQLYRIRPNLVFNAGLRLTKVTLQSTFIDKAVFPFPFSDAEQDNTNVSGNLGLTYNMTGNWKLGVLASSGFHAPNIDDLGKVFDSRAGALVVPNPDIKPENTYNGEINISKLSQNFSFNAAAFYTLFRNALIVAPFTYGTQTTVLYQGVNSQVLANQNRNKAFLYGGSAGFRATAAGNTDFEGSIAYTYGRVQTDTGRIPLDHVPPVYGRFGIKHRQAKWNAELFTLFNGAKKIKDYSNSGEDNQQYATVDGMPSWYTLNLRLQYNMAPQVAVLAGVENMTDKNYRTFASGISAPGRNFVISFRAGF
jgi:hemoglobin/transferrin/lactoferrin receptor protein